MQIHDLTLTEAATLLRAGSLTSVQLVTDLLRRANENLTLNAFSELDAEAVIAAARACDQRAAQGGNMPILHGLPISLKDNIACRGYRMQANTPSLSDFRPEGDAAVAERLKAAGAIIFGKNTMHEIAFGGTSNNAFGGPVRNAFDPERIPAGSSGGTASAVGGRLVPAGIGSDTGGSVRVPASFNGVFGYRPSTGRWPSDGVLPLSSTRDTLGPLARSIADIDLIDRAITPREPAVRREVSTLRLGKPTGFFWEDLSADVRSRCDHALALLSSQGATVVEIDLQPVLAMVHEIAFPIVFFETGPMLKMFLEEWQTGVTVDELLDQVASPDVASVAAVLRDPAQAIPEEFYRHAVDKVIPAIRDAYASIATENALDAIVFPTCPITAPRIGEDETTSLNGESVPTFLTVIRNMDLGSIIALPGISVPVGTGADGLPVGMMFEGSPQEDEALIGVVLGVESALPSIPKPKF